MDALRSQRPRRPIAQVLVLLVISVCLSGCDDASVPDLDPMAPAVDVALPDSPIDLSTLLPTLERQLLDHGATLHPPLGDAALERLQKSLPCRLPHLLAQIYRWHDGVDRIVPAYDLLPLAQVVEDYHAIQAMERDIGVPESAGWPKTYLPILRMDAQEYIALDCTAPDQGALLHNFNEDPRWDARYRGLGHFLRVTSSAYELGAYRLRDGDLDEWPLRYAQAFRAHAHPQELTALEAHWSKVSDALAHGSSAGLRLAVTWATMFPHERYVAVLVRRLSDRNPAVVAIAAFALGELRAQDAEPALAIQLSHPSGEVRNFAAGALARLERIDPQSGTVGTLIALLDDPDELVRLSAIEALATARSSTAVAPLVAVLAHSRPGIQLQVVHTLGELRDRSALAALRQLRAQLAAQSPLPDRGGTRGSDPPPQRLLAAVDDALRKIGP